MVYKPKNNLRKIFFLALICCVFLVCEAKINSNKALAAILFQDDDFQTAESASLLLGSNDAGTSNTSIRFGADPTTTENGNITWNISTNHFGFDNPVDITGGLTASTVTSTGLLTASNGLTLTTGALNLTGTSGALNLSGLSASSISTGANIISFTAGNFNTTSTGINNTAIGATTASTGVFTTLQANSTLTAAGNLLANGNTTLGDAATDALTFTGEIRGATPLVFEGATDNNTYTNFAITDPTSARTITFPDATGTVSLDTIYQNQTIKTAPKIWTGSATTTTGVATFFPTSDNTGTGTALFTNIYSVQVTANTNTASAIAVPVASVKLIAADKRSITANAITGQNVGILGAASVAFAPNGTVLNMVIVGD